MCLLLVSFNSIILYHATDALALATWDISTVIFTTLWVGFLLLIGYSFIKSCLRGGSTSTTNGRGSTPRPGPSQGWFPGAHPDNDAPPPYTYQKPTEQSEGWRPGFWSGAATGALAGSLLNRQNDRTYDWERERRAQATSSSWFSSRQTSGDRDRGEGSSSGSTSLGATRRSTGLGGSNVR